MSPICGNTKLSNFFQSIQDPVLWAKYGGAATYHLRWLFTVSLTTLKLHTVCLTKCFSGIFILGMLLDPNSNFP